MHALLTQQELADLAGVRLPHDKPHRERPRGPSLQHHPQAGKGIGH